MISNDSTLHVYTDEGGVIQSELIIVSMVFLNVKNNREPQR